MTDGRASRRAEARAWAPARDLARTVRAACPAPALAAVTCAVLAAVLAVAPAAGVAAQDDPGALARRAAADLDAAAAGLARADGARDRVAALTRTVRAYEDGLAALRDGMRRAGRREQAIRARFDAESDRLGRLIGALQVINRTPETTLLLHPSGAVGTARSGMILSDVSPALAAEVGALREDLEELATLRALQASAADTLGDGLAGIQAARTRLSQAVSDRTDLPRRVTEDPDEMRRLLASTETLSGFASGLAALPEDDDAPELPDFAQAQGDLGWPVAGDVLRGFEEADAAGVRRPGLVIAARPGAVVTTPWPATIRYLGPLLDYRNVAILEPSEGYLMIFAGLDEVFGTVGQVVPDGTPLGLMPGLGPETAAYFGNVTAGEVTPPPETLYVELRQDNAPVDPAAWFRRDEN
ncbi:peptidase M23 [Mesobaculum littorinae]|uniref:Peptidase M23 n=1 Tax=Mesobaculum littorinae TaxID=2486419 RepID=A0A438AHL7_9RHOB|nr:peptidoglycan DD-metalloendopeptidase family protein [Mesobaculum littorinae]RVV98182.1 peptidase M23 [Mesobaculum littorinae]